MSVLVIILNDVSILFKETIPEGMPLFLFDDATKFDFHFVATKWALSYPTWMVVLTAQGAL